MEKHKVPDPEEEPLLSVEKAGACLQLSRASAYSAVRRGEIPVVRFGRRMMVPTGLLRTMLGLGNRDAS